MRNILTDMLIQMCNLFDAGISVWFLEQYFNLKCEKNRLWKSTSVWMVLFISLSCGLHWEWNHLLTTGLWLCILLAYSRSCLTGSRIEQLLMCLTGLLMIPLINVYWLQMFSALSRIPVEQFINTESSLYVCAAIISKIFLAGALYIILFVFRKQKIRMPKIYQTAVSVILGFSILIEGTFFYIIKSETLMSSLRWGVAGASFGVMVIDIFLFGCIYKLSMQNMKEEEWKLLKVQNNLQTQQIEMMQHIQKQSSRFRHDYRNHICNIQELLDNGEMAELKMYVKNVEQYYFKHTEEYVDTKNPIIDAVLNVKFGVCSMEGIEVTCIVSGNYIDMDTFKLGIVLSNLLDNAIEACRKEKNRRELRLEMFQNACYLNILIRNAVSESILENNPNLDTTKNDDELHGIGIRHASELINQLGGMFEVYELGGFFCTHVMIPIISLDG